MSQQPTFSRIGSIVRAIANYTAYALGLSIIIGIASLFSAVAGPYVAVGGLIIIAALCSLALFRVLVLTRDLMDAVHTLGDSRNIVQFKLFARFLFNSIAVGLIGFFWAIICALIMFTPAFFPDTTPFYDYNTAIMSPTILTSMAGEITLCIIAIVIGLAYIPHSYKAWKLVDDYFVMLHDPWARDIGLLGTKKVLDGHKVAFGVIFMVFGAIGYQIAAFAFFIPTVAVCSLVAGVKYIQGLFRVGTGFSRIPTSSIQPLFQPQPPVATRQTQTTYQQPSVQPPSPQPAYLRYQPTQSIYNRGTAQGTPSPDPLANTTGIQRQIIQRNHDFLQMLDDDAPGQRQGQQQPRTQSLPAQGSPVMAPINPVTLAAQVSITPSVAPTATAGSPNRCKYCFADLTSGNTGKCPGCGAALLPF